MKHFFFVVTKKPKNRNGKSQSTINLWCLQTGGGLEKINQTPIRIDFQSPEQCAVEALIDRGLIPAEALQDATGSHGYPDPDGRRVKLAGSLKALREQGILNIQELS